MKTTRVLLAGGGTGGHIYPALAIAKFIQEKNPQNKIEFVGSRRGLEKDIVPKHGFKLHMLTVGQLHSSVGRLKQIKTLLLMPIVFLQALWIVIKFRPHFVLGVGGYASGPLVLVASLLGIRTGIWEANVEPGITNKILSKFVKRCFVVFEDSQKFFPPHKTQCLGYPVRKEFEVLYQQKKTQEQDSTSAATSEASHSVSQNSSSSSPSPGSSTFKVLIFGGSQGAAVFNRVIPKVAARFPEIQFTLQTGSKNYAEFEGKKWTDNLQVLPFLDPIVDHYLQADLIISRSGAGAIAELSAIGAHCLFVPFPKASDDHQRKNAEALQALGAADMILEDQFTEEEFAGFLQQYLKRSVSQNTEMQKNMLDFFKSGATQAIVEALIKKS